MAVVRAVGAVVTLPDPPPEADRLDVVIRLFAELQDGERVEAEGPFSAQVDAPELPGDEAALQHVVRSALRHQGLERRHRESYWGGLVAALRSRDIVTDEETLIGLPFETIELDDEVRRLFSG